MNTVPGCCKALPTTLLQQVLTAVVLHHNVHLCVQQPRCASFVVFQHTLRGQGLRVFAACCPCKPRRFTVLGVRAVPADTVRADVLEGAHPHPCLISSGELSVPSCHVRSLRGPWLWCASLLCAAAAVACASAAMCALLQATAVRKWLSAASSQA